MGRKSVEKNISKDTERNIYYVCLNWGKGSDGKYHKTYETTSNLKEARRILKRHQEERASGKAVLPVRETLVTFVDEFIKYKELSLAATTIYGYKKIFMNHIKPYFGEELIQSVTPQVRQNYVIQKREQGLSMATINKHLALLRSVLEDAARKQIIARNPVNLLERPKVKKAQRIFLDTAEVAALLLSVKGTCLELPVTLAVYLGMRRGEVLGLRWSDIDFEGGILQISSTRTKAGGNVIVKDPKTDKSRRAFKMPQEVKMVLWQAKQKKDEVKRKFKGYDTSDYVVTRHDGKPFSPNYLSDLFHQHVLKTGMKHVRFHDLRHAFASIANNAGVPMAAISSAMGHSNMGVTSSVYVHDFMSLQETAVNAVAQSIAQAQKQQIACDKE